LSGSFSVAALDGFPLVQPGDDIASLICDRLDAMNLTLQHHDVLVITSKIVSKAEGCVVNLSDVEPTDDALRYAKITGKDPRVVELVLRDSHAVSRAAKNVLVVEHRLGFVCANAGIDQSNVEGDDETVLLLPIDPDGTAASIHDVLRQRYDVEVGVIISDSHGRPFRLGTVGVAIGVAGMPGMLDLRGQTDLYGRELKISIQGYADLVASAAQLATGEGAEGRPVVLVRGLSFTRTDGNAAELNRPVQEDLYR
jgi:coenzyme F420-0:L-glutamate ligase/coenzyme F420-1:gamma-L-glutamate ligase